MSNTTKILLTREDFIEAIEDVAKVNEYYEKRNEFYAANGVDGYIFEPECCDTVIKLLHLFFGDFDKDGAIAQFCFRGNFGKKKKECRFVDDSRKECEILTAGDLYDYLLGNYQSEK